MKQWDVPLDEAVVTTSYVTEEKLPILEVCHEHDGEGGVIWQFHCGNDDFSAAVLRLVRLDELLGLDPSIGELSNLPVGYCAKRSAMGEDWVRARLAVNRLSNVLARVADQRELRVSAPAGIVAVNRLSNVLARVADQRELRVSMASVKRFIVCRSPVSKPQ